MVIPANAGVILFEIRKGAEEFSYPRECGGDPKRYSNPLARFKLSPRMRG